MVAHEMIVVAYCGDGVEYYCGVCGRRVFLRYSTDLKEVIVVGDPSADHVLEPYLGEKEKEGDDPYLDVYDDYMKKRGKDDKKGSDNNDPKA